MNKNVGNIDKLLRMIIGIVIVAVGLYYKSWLTVLGFIPLVTAVAGWCPLYALFGIVTNRKQKTV
ncbi:DUF2892 domain-containing protein [candidate division KSB1 bacterium]|nr:DUF2892 domain-containing protein [candidate division KSB1 bacterium]